MSEMTEIPPIQEPPKEDVSTTDDPRVFFDAFRQSDSYNNSYQTRLSKLSPSPDVTEDELKEAFEDTEDAKIAMLTFAEKEMRFRYNPDNFDAVTNEAVNDYIESVKFMFKALRTGGVSGGGRAEDQEAILDADRYRSGKHNALSKILKDNNYTSTEKLGRTMARIILVDKGLDNFDNASINDLERMQRLIGG